MLYAAALPNIECWANKWK